MIVHYPLRGGKVLCAASAKAGVQRKESFHCTVLVHEEFRQEGRLQHGDAQLSKPGDQRLLGTAEASLHIEF